MSEKPIKNAKTSRSLYLGQDLNNQAKRGQIALVRQSLLHPRNRREIITVRGQSYVLRLPKYCPPLPLWARRLWTPPPPAFVAGGGYTRRVERGVGGESIFWKTQDTALYSIFIESSLLETKNVLTCCLPAGGAGWEWWQEEWDGALYSAHPLPPSAPHPLPPPSPPPRPHSRLCVPPPRICNSVKNGHFHETIGPRTK
jgi:hypothetical protein